MAELMEPRADRAAEFEAALYHYVEGCKRIAAEYTKKYYPGPAPEPVWRIDELKRYYRVVQETGAHSFIDKMSGDVLKAETFARPAKHARGNIFDKDNGLKLMGPHGPAYLR